MKKQLRFLFLLWVFGYTLKLVSMLGFPCSCVACLGRLYAVADWAPIWSNRWTKREIL
jgi:hypothetical protein